MASKEVKGHDIKEELIRETNEQMLLKPLYTSEDYKPSSEPEIPGVFPFKRGPCYYVYT